MLHPDRQSAIAALASLLFACGTSAVHGACGDDSACAAGLHCVMGNCICEKDSDCRSGETCNASGFCQAMVGCQTSQDCASGMHCDTPTGNCIPTSQCTEDTDCPLGSVCNTESFECVPGCHEAGDCPLGEVCECPAGETCPSGSILSCIPGPCGDDSYCAYGDICQAEYDGGPKACAVDTRGPFCQSCAYQPGSPNACPGNGADFCLLDTGVTYNTEFCGVDCSQGQECPNGFTCDDVLILTDTPCSATVSCPLRPPPACNSTADCVAERGGQCDVDAGTCACITNDDCPGGLCEPVSGQCRSTCEVNEGDPRGFCSCLEDTDCPTDSCDSETGRCVIQQTPCGPGTPCSPIFCKKVADQLSGVVTGYCYIGQNCAPIAGVSCSEVLSDTP